MGKGCKARIGSRFGWRCRLHHVVQPDDKFLEKRGLHAARGMLLAVATASCWTQELRYRGSPLCPRCEEEDEDMHHRVWQDTGNICDILDKTENLVQKATQAKTLWTASGSGGLCHDPGLCKTQN